MLRLEDQTGVFLELDSGLPRSNDRGFLYCKELGIVTLTARLNYDPWGNWFRFNCHWDPKKIVSMNDDNCKQIERSQGCFVVDSELIGINSELGYERECRDNGRVIAKFAGSGLVLEVYKDYMYLWHCHVGVIIHVKGQHAQENLDEVFVPLQPICFKAVALNCPNRFISFSATHVRAHIRYRPCNLFFAQNVKIVDVDGHWLARTQDGKNIILLDENFSLLQRKPRTADYSVAYFQVLTKNKEVVYLSAFLTDEEEYNEVFESLIQNRGSENPFDDINSESSCGENAGFDFFKNLQIYDIDDDPLDWYFRGSLQACPEQKSQEPCANVPLETRPAISTAQAETFQSHLVSQDEKLKQLLFGIPHKVAERRLVENQVVAPSVDSSVRLNESTSLTEELPPIKKSTAPINMDFLFMIPQSKTKNKSSSEAEKAMTTTNYADQSMESIEENEDLSFRDDTTFLKNPTIFDESSDAVNLDRLNNKLRAISCVIRKNYKKNITAQLEKDSLEFDHGNTDARESSPELQAKRSDHGSNSTIHRNLAGSCDERDVFNISNESNQVFTAPQVPLAETVRSEDMDSGNAFSNHSNVWKEKRREDFPKSANRYKTGDVNSARFMEEKYRNLTKRLINENSTEFVERAWGKVDSSENRTIRLVLFSIATDSGTRCAVRAFSRDVVLLLIHAVYSPEEPFFLFDLQRTGINLRDVEDNDPYLMLTFVERHVFDMIRSEQSLWNYILQSLDFINDMSLPTV